MSGAPCRTRCQARCQRPARRVAQREPREQRYRSATTRTAMSCSVMAPTKRSSFRTVELHNRDPSGEAASNRVSRAYKSHAFAHRLASLHRYSPVGCRLLAAAQWRRNPGTPLLRQSRPLANGTRMILAPNHGLRQSNTGAFGYNRAIRVSAVLVRLWERNPVTPDAAQHAVCLLETAKHDTGSTLSSMAGAVRTIQIGRKPAAG